MKHYIRAFKIALLTILLLAFIISFVFIIDKYVIPIPQPLPTQTVTIDNKDYQYYQPYPEAVDTCEMTPEQAERLWNGQQATKAILAKENYERGREDLAREFDLILNK